MYKYFKSKYFFVLKCLHPGNGANGLLGEIEPLHGAIGMPALVQPLYAVVVDQIHAVPGVHAEAEQVHRAAHVVVGVGQMWRVLVGGRTATAGGLWYQRARWACKGKEKYRS